jgi:adenylate kinase family enzyme
MQHTKDIILLIGAPGAGKSLLGELLQKNTPTKVTFLSVGNRLREEGLVDDYFHCTASAAEKGTKRADMRLAARIIIEKGIKELTAGSTLALECVKDIDDAFVLMDIIRSSPEARLKHVLYVSHKDVGSELFREFKITVGAAVRREQERNVLERQGKWESNAQALIEFFTSMDIAIEVSTQRFGAALAQLGYARNGASLSHRQRAWDREQHSLPPQLLFAPLEPVVSKRLIVDRKAIDNALREAEEITGLAMFSSEAKFAVPSTAIKSTADAEWISWPGRYCVSRKCDGTRHLLIISGKGSALMLNRAGAAYEYPITTPLPAGAMLDGELVWIAGRGFFIAFDILSAGAGHTRAWQLPLPDRIALLSQVLRLDEAEACDELHAAAAEQKRRTAGQPPQDAWSMWVHMKDECRARVQAESAAELAMRRVQRSGSSGERRRAMKYSAMSVEEWERTPEFKGWRDTRMTHIMWASINSTAVLRVLHKKQQASLENDEVKVVWKNHLDVSSQSLQLLEETLPACPYPTDGLVFTPRECPYALGMTEMLRKWQPINQAAGDIRTTSYNSTPELRHMQNIIHPMQLVDGLVYECFLDRGYQLPSIDTDTGRLLIAGRNSFHSDRKSETRGWRPASIRWDKRNGNSNALLLRMAEVGECLSMQDLVKVAASVDERYQAIVRQPQPQSTPIHPARTFASPLLLREAIMAAVADGKVEHTTDAETGLEIFNRLPLRGTQPTPVEALCRGLVLHGTTIVATPFTCFPEQPWCSARNHDELARAAFKVDGSLAIAFIWDGQVHVSTRRRMDSQQARWTREWLRENVAAEDFVEGWTYLFEAVFKDNTVVVPYAFEAPVLLAIIASDGARLQHGECAEQARRMGVIMTPSITGTLAELEMMLPNLHTASPPSHEGWVVTLDDGTNTKRVTKEYEQASMAKIHLHPLTVWDRVRTGGERREEMLHNKGLTKHHSNELAAILDALQTAYDGVTRRMLPCFRVDAGGGEAWPQELTAALKEIIKAGTRNKESMHYTYWSGSKIRVLLMDCIRPGFDGSLPGYTPSILCTNTIAKDWAKGPRSGRLAAGAKPLILAKLHEPSLLALVLEQLEGGTMCNAMLVNKEWNSVICLAAGFHLKAKQVVRFHEPYVTQHTLIHSLQVQETHDIRRTGMNGVQVGSPQSDRSFADNDREWYGYGSN